MKNIFIQSKKEDKVELPVKKQKEISPHFAGVIQPQKGQKVFEVNEKTGDVTEAEYRQNTTTFIVGQKLEPPRLIMKPNCVYIPAMNVKNAVKKYAKNKSQENYFVKEAPMKL
jgi:hypothetical protein